jgi:hypothetical protein
MISIVLFNILYDGHHFHDSNYSKKAASVPKQPLLVLRDDGIVNKEHISSSSTTLPEIETTVLDASFHYLSTDLP